MATPLTIDHQPTGNDHPYETAFEERRPRDPAGGDMVSIGFSTRPGGAANGVQLDWSRNGRRQAPIHARPAHLGGDEDRWIVDLGVIEGGDQVEYRISAANGGDVVEAGPFRFVARRWHSAVVLRAVEATEVGGRVALFDGAGERGPDVTIEHAEGSLRLRFTPAVGDPGEAIDGEGSLALPRVGGEHRKVRIRWEESDGRLSRIELTAEKLLDETFAGFGERFDALDQQGRAPDVRVYEQYKNQGNRTYMPIPFFLSCQGFGLLVEGTTPVEYDLGRTVPDRWRCQIDVPGSGELGLTWYVGEPEAIVRAYTAQTGRPAPMPRWAYGLWMSSNEWNTQARVEREVAATHEHNIPATVLVIEAWSDETTFYTWNGAVYEPRDPAEEPKLADFTFPADGPWPDPAGMTKALREAGIRLILWQIPALKKMDGPHVQHDADVAFAIEHGYVVKNGDGSPYKNPFFWFREAHIPDFTSEAATAWWLGKRRYLLDEMGIDGFKTDGAEHLTGRDLLASDGRRGDELINAYPALYTGAYSRYARERRDGDALLFSRAGHTGSGAFAAHWAGDENSTWEAFRRSIVAGLTAGISGIIFWGWDIAGFSDELPGTELYGRSAAMAAFCPIMQYHSEYNPTGPSRDRTPWNLAEKTGDPLTIPLFRHFVRVRMNLLPYLVEEGAFAAENGTPLMRPLFLDHPDDPVCWEIEDQYRFGRAMLVATIVEEGATTRRLYLPAGEWTELWTGARHHGPAWITVDAPLHQIPVFVPSGFAIPLRLGRTGSLGEDTGNGLSVTGGLTIWLAGDRGESSFALDGEPVDVKWANGDVTLQARTFPVRVVAPGYAPAVIHPATEPISIHLERSDWAWPVVAQGGVL